jgi:hypothetical protein
MRLTHPGAAAVAVLTCLSLVTPAAAAAQARGSRAETETVRTTPGATGMTAVETRRDLEELMKQYPPALPRILRLDPSLLGNSAYLAPYPALTAFLAQHPEIAHNPGFFLAEYEFNVGDPRYRLTAQDRAIAMWRDVIEGFTIGAVALAITAGLVWLIKTLIDYRRWSRLSKVQTEVHTKLLDRFQSNQELLAYIETPAGKRFLESAPIAMESPRAIGAPVGRILWSAQAGAVLTVLGMGILIVSRRTLEEIAPPLGAFGAIIISLGIGFIVSAVLAYALTRRFGLLNAPPASDARG